MTDEKTPNLNTPPSAFVPPPGSGLERAALERLPPEAEDERDATLAGLGREVSELKARVEQLEAELRAGLDAVGRALAKQPAAPAPDQLQGREVAGGQSGLFSQMSAAEREEYRRGLGFIR